MIRLTGIAVSTVALAAAISCGPQASDGSSSSTHPIVDTPEATAARGKARAFLLGISYSPRITGDRACQTTTVGAYNDAEAVSGKAVTMPIIRVPEVTPVWVCDFDVVFDHPPVLRPGLSPPSPWPAGGMKRIARIVILPDGGYAGDYYESEPPPLKS